MGSLKGFEKFLNSYRKKSGETIMPNTKKGYIYYIKDYVDIFVGLEDDIDVLIDKMNSIINGRPNIVIYSSFKMYLLYIGVDKRDLILKKLRTPEKRPNSSNSKKYLQSKIMSRQEIKRLFDDVDDEMKLIFSFLYDTLCRKSEMLGVLFEDIKYVKNPDKIYAVVKVLSKGGDTRNVYLSKLTTTLLLKLRAGSNPKDKVFVFYKDEEKKEKYVCQGDRLYNMVTKETERVLGRKIGVHSWRHTGASHLAENSMDLTSLSKLMNHKDFSTTKIYLHLSDNVAKKGFEKFSKDILEEDEFL